MVVTLVESCPLTPDSELLRALQEVVQALDRRKPHAGRTGEATIAADSRRLRAEASARIALLQDPTPGTTS